MNKMLANYITMSRIIIAIVLLCFSTVNSIFIILYTIGGITDMIDGVIARKMKISSELGSRLDTVADLIFGILIFKILIPYLVFPYLWWFIVIAILKISAVFINFIKYNKVIIIHTYFNKLTGFLLFIFIYLISFKNIDIYLILIGLIATITSLEEIMISLTSHKLNLDRKSIIEKE